MLLPTAEMFVRKAGLIGAQAGFRSQKVMKKPLRIFKGIRLKDKKQLSQRTAAYGRQTLFSLGSGF